MARYFYRSDCGKQATRFFPMRDGPIDGFEEDGVEFYRDYGREQGHRIDPGIWPQISEAAGVVHPEEIPEAMALDEQVGAPKINYTEDGAAEFRDRRQRAAWMKAHGHYDKDGGYCETQ